MPPPNRPHASIDQKTSPRRKTRPRKLWALRPPVVPRHEDPRFAQDPQAWTDACAEYQTQYQNLLRKLPGLGQSLFIELGSQIDRSEGTRSSPTANGPTPILLPAAA